MEEATGETAGEQEELDRDWDWSVVDWVYWYHNYDDGRYRRGRRARPMLGRKRSALFNRYDKSVLDISDGIFSNSILNSQTGVFACHSACHDACHSACHDACHSACHRMSFGLPLGLSLGVCQRGCKMKEHKLEWVDDFLARIKPYVYMRLKDNVLIRMPNEAFKLNTTGARIIAHVLDGGSVWDFVKMRSDLPDIEEQLERFFVDFLRIWNNEICENYATTAVQRVEFTNDYIEFPILSEVALTYACNIRCRFCYAGCTGGTGFEELEVNEFKKILDIIRYEAGVPSVSFTGGEPLLFKDLAKLIKYASKVNKMRVNLITNGTLITPKKAKQFARAGLASAQVSIESGDSFVHDSITGVPGSHKASVEGFKALMAEGITVHPHFTICKPNRESILQYPKFCEEIGAQRFSANLVIPAGRGSDQELTVSYSEIREIIDEIKRESSRVVSNLCGILPPRYVCLIQCAGFGNRDAVPVRDCFP